MAEAEKGSARTSVGVLYTAASALSRENELLARYVGLCLAAGGMYAKVAVVAVPGGAKSAGDETSTTASAALRSDGVIVEKQRLPAGLYEETGDLEVLKDCALWVLLLDTSTTLQTAEKLAEKLDKRFKKTDAKRKRVVLSLQTTMRRLAQLSQAFPDSIVLHGGVGFQVAQDENGVLRQVAHGCYFMERLAQEKVAALFAVDLLESTGVQVLSRRNVQALKWGTTMLRTFYYVNALTGLSVHEGLRDRNVRLIYLQTLVEMWDLLELVMANNAARVSELEGKGQASAASWAPDPIAATYLPIHSVMVLLPLPNWIFNTLIMWIFDFGLADASFTGQAVTTLDFVAGLQTGFEDEFSDMFELAKGRSRPLPTLEWLKTTLATATTAVQKNREKTRGSGTPESPITIRSSVLRAQVAIAPQSIAISRTFFFKLTITVVLTVLLILYLIR